MRLLLVEDDPYLQENLVRSLSRRGLQVTSASTAAQALNLWQSLRPDVALLDLTLPDGDGLTVVSQIRQQGFTTPVLVLTARATVGDRVLGLNSGADDYMAKPFDLDELEARLNALYRRAKSVQQSVSVSDREGVPGRSGLTTLQMGAISLDTLNGVAYFHQQAMELTPREVAMLHALMAHAGQAVAKERLFSAVFPDELDVQFEAIEVVAYRLRKKLADTGISLVTLRGLGYLLKAAN
ncbi:MAG: DNA-binding response regulator [Betaproteobacteria bacterium]|nr:DNA-binding response regulator [Betaproteobacteria bacterium]